MKARVKATGEIAHVRPYGGNSSSILWKDIYRNITYADCELDFEVTNKDEIYNKGWSDGWDEAVKSEIEKEAFNKGLEAGFAKVCDKLCELKSGYEKDLDSEPRIYERDIQLCAKISLIERLIIELKEE